MKKIILISALMLAFTFSIKAQLLKITDVKYNRTEQKITVWIQMTEEARQKYSRIDYEVFPINRTIADLLYGGSKYGSVTSSDNNGTYVSFDCKREDNQFQRCDNYSFDWKVTDKKPK